MSNGYHSHWPPGSMNNVPMVHPSTGLHGGDDLGYDHYSNSANSGINNELVIRSHNIQLSASLDAEKRVNHELREMNTQLHAMNTQLHQINTELRQTLSSLVSRPLPDPLHAPSSDNPLKRLAKPLEPLLAENFPNVTFWTFNQWIEHCEMCKNGGKNIGKLDFLTDANGVVCSKDRRKEFTRYENGLFNQLYLHRLDPRSWTKRVAKVSEYICKQMKAQFIEFRYCEGDWKAEQFATIKYPDWSANQRESGQLTREKPSIDSSNKRKSDDSGTTRHSRKKHKTKSETKPVLPSANIIDIDSDNMESESVQPKPSRPQPRIIDKQPLEQDTVSSSGKTASSSESSAPLECPPASEPHASANSDVDMPQRHARFKNPLIPRPTNLPSRNPSPPLPDKVSQPLSNNNPATTRPPVINPLASLEIPAIHVVPTINEPTPETRTLPPPPKPSAETANSVTEAGSSTLEPETMPSGTGAPSPPAESLASKSKQRSGKTVKPTTANSARNLFCIDYIKTHSPTTKEFAVIWNALDAETKKKYEDLSKAKKKGTTAPSDATVAAPVTPSENDGHDL